MLFEYCFLSISVIAQLAYVNAFTSRRRVFSVHGTPFTHLTKKANRAFITFHDIRKLVSSVPEKQKVANADDNFSLFAELGVVLVDSKGLLYLTLLCLLQMIWLPAQRKQKKKDEKSSKKRGMAPDAAVYAGGFLAPLNTNINIL